MKKILIGLLAFVSISAFAETRVKNPCWNTSLSERGEQICAICTPAVDAMISHDTLSPCKKEQMAVFTCLVQRDRCTNYQEILTKKDNCITNLVKACFEKL